MNKKKALILYASVGTGHKMAAFSIEKALKERGFSTTLRDTLDFFGDFLKEKLRDSQRAINALTGNIYDYFWKLDLFSPTEEKFGKIILRLSQNLEQYVLQEKPDIIVSTHALSAIPISYFKKKGLLLKVAHITISTDFRSHKCWPSSEIDFYVVANQEAKKDLMQTGTLASTIKVLGIPLRKEFSRPQVEKETKRYELPVVLFLSGAVRKGLYAENERVLKKLLKRFGDYSGFLLFVITGLNKALKQELEEYINEKGLENIKVFGFIEDMAGLMKDCDLLITKPGGLISSESLAVGLPMILIGKHFGQERANAKYLERNGVAVKIKKSQDIYKTVKRLIRDKKALSEMKSKALKIAKPRATEDIINLIGDCLSDCKQFNDG